MASLSRLHLFALAFSLFPLLFELSLGATLSCSAMVILFYVTQYIVVVALPRWLPQMLALGSGVMVYFIYGTLLSPEAASTLMCLQVVFKLFDIRSHRDVMMFLLMNLLLSMFYVVFNQTLLSTTFVFTNYFFFIFFLLNLHKQKLGVKQDPLSLKQLVSVEILVALPLLISLFLFFPRFSSSWGGFGAATTDAVIGFSNHLNPGQMQDLAQSDLVAFRFIPKNKKVPQPEELYFKGAVLTENRGWAWKESSRRKVVLDTDNVKDPFDYEILLEPRYEKSLFVLESTSHIQMIPESAALIKYADQAYALSYPAQGKIKIRGWIQKDKNLLDTPLAPKIISEGSERLKELLKDFTSLTYEEKLNKLLEFYKTSGFQYSTEAPRYTTIDDFIFGKRIGFCEHFASSFGVLARLVGLKTRLVIGFQGAEYNSFGDYLVIKDKHAHAWNEVYFENEGWRRVDVTATVAPGRIFQGRLGAQGESVTQDSQSLGAWLQLAQAWDAINNRFNLMLMNYNYSSQEALLESLNLKKWGLGSLLRLMTGLLIVFSLIFWWLSKRGEASLDLLARAYLLMNKKLSQKSVMRLPSEGPIELKQKVIALKDHDETVLRLIDRYIALRFGPNASSQDVKTLYKDIKRYFSAF